ncbi:MAG: ribosome-associated translation inhibitor RaiA [Patescibacteria group bacterium]
MIKINKIKGTNIELTSAISDYAAKKVSQLEKFVAPDDTSAMVDVEVGKTTKHHQTGDVFRAEFNLFVGGKQYNAASEKEDLYAALDDVKDEIARELSKSKTRTRDLARRGGASIKNIVRGFFNK